MTRALSLTCLALFMVGMAGSVAFAKPSIAILGLEVVDPNGTPTAADTQAAKELTDGLRARAKAGSGPYGIAPASDKELIDQKLLNNCDNEAVGCMAAIGGQMGAEFLMYGNLKKNEKDKSYVVSMKLLDVPHKTIKSTTVTIPASEASGGNLQGWAKTIYSKLTGDTSSAGGTLVVKLNNAERGTILINGEEKGTITGGSGTVAGLEGKSYTVAIQSDGFKRYEREVTIGTNKTETVEVDLEHDTGKSGGGGGGGSGPWKIGLAAGLAVAAGGGGLWIYGYTEIDGARRSECTNGIRADGGCSKYTNMDGPTGTAPASGNPYEDRGKKGSAMSFVGGGILAVGVAVAAFSVYKIVSSKPPTERQAARGRRTRNNRTFVVTPVISPSGGGATLRIDW